MYNFQTFVIWDVKGSSQLSRDLSFHLRQKFNENFGVQKKYNSWCVCVYLIKIITKFRKSPSLTKVG